MNAEWNDAPSSSGWWWMFTPKTNGVHPVHVFALSEISLRCYAGCKWMKLEPPSVPQVETETTDRSD